MTQKITVLLADDHHLVRRGFRRLLEDDPRIDVVGEAADGNEAIRLTAELRPQVVVMDAAMPGTSGMAATRAIRAAAPEIAVEFIGPRQVKGRSEPVDAYRVLD